MSRTRRLQRDQESPRVPKPPKLGAKRPDTVAGKPSVARKSHKAGKGGGPGAG